MGMLNSIAHDFVTCDLGIKANNYIWRHLNTLHRNQDQFRKNLDRNSLYRLTDLHHIKISQLMT